MIAHDISQNCILAELPARDRERLFQDLEFVQMPLGQTVYASGLQLSHVYFPTTAIISLLYEMEGGSSHEVAMVGNEGVVGVSLFMGGEATVSRAVVQGAGHAYQLGGKLLKSEFHRDSFIQHLLLRYTFALMTEIAQTLVCNSHHSKDQQLCRWLLLRFDRLPSNSLAITQDQISNLLGVRRNVISEIAINLQAAGLIKLNRGRIDLLDRAGLEARVCECYALIKGRLDK
jgi:CRP-like cAMP-binding protein